MTSIITKPNEIQSKVQNVPATLGVCHYDHLGLVCNKTLYLKFPRATKYIRPEKPKLEIPEKAITAQIAVVGKQYLEATRQLTEVVAVERAFKQQIVLAMDSKYIKTLCARGTNQITVTIPELFYHLFTTYNNVTKREL